MIFLHSRHTSFFPYYKLVMESRKFDLVIIGGGPAGYVAAIRAAQLGVTVVCVEKNRRLGGTCLNVGCIPSKALLESSQRFYDAKHNLGKFGVVVDEPRLDLSVLMQHKDGVVNQLGQGIESLFRKNKVERILGTAKLEPRQGQFHQVSVATDTGTVKLDADKVLLATGSVVSELPTMKFDGSRIISSTEALSLPKVPSHLIVVGAGYVGLEMGSVWARLGAKVTVVEYLDRILPNSDQQAARELQKALQKQGLAFRLSTKCKGARSTGAGVIVQAEDANGDSEDIEGEYVLVATGRKPYTEGLGLEALGVRKTNRGYLEINDRFETSVPGVYAVGDIVKGPMLAHKASEEAVAAVEYMQGRFGYVNYNAIPSIIYTHPELASVGATEEELKARNIEYKSGVFPFFANARAKSMLDTAGFCKVLADAKSDRVLGVHLVGPLAGELIHHAVSVIEFGGSAEDIALTCHAHPTLAEVLKEAALNVEGRAIHF